MTHLNVELMSATEQVKCGRRPDIDFMEKLRHNPADVFVQSGCYFVQCCVPSSGKLQGVDEPVFSDSGSRSGSIAPRSFRGRCPSQFTDSEPEGDEPRCRRGTEERELQNEDGPVNPLQRLDSLRPRPAGTSRSLVNVHYNGLNLGNPTSITLLYPSNRTGIHWDVRDVGERVLRSFNPVDSSSETVERDSKLPVPRIGNIRLCASSSPALSAFFSHLWSSILPVGFLPKAMRSSWTGSLMESLGLDQDEIRGTLQDLGDGGVPGVSGASLDGDGETFKVGWEGAGVALEASSPATTLQPGRGPSGDGFGGRSLDRSGRLIRAGGSGTELAVEGLVDEGAQPSADVEMPLGAEALEPLTGFGRDADMKWYTVRHNDTH